MRPVVAWRACEARAGLRPGRSSPTPVALAMNPLPAAAVLQQLRWRYSVKRFDPTRKIAPADWAPLEEALVLTPSSYNLQPWRFLVITDQATKDKLHPASYHQKQIVEGSHVVVLAIRKHLRVEDIDQHIARVAAVRGTTPDALAGYRTVAVGDLIDGARSLIITEWATRQIYIALGNVLATAAMLGIDTCPMEGFEPVKYDQILGLARRGLSAALVCVFGYRSADDKYAKLPKVRFPVESLVEHIEQK